MPLNLEKEEVNRSPAIDGAVNCGFEVALRCLMHSDQGQLPGQRQALHAVYCMYSTAARLVCCSSARIQIGQGCIDDERRVS